MNRSYKQSHRLTLLTVFTLLMSNNIFADEWTDSYKLEAKGNFSAAAAVLKPFLTKKPINEFALLRHAWLNYSSRNYNDAIRDYQQALTLNPNSLDARLGLILPMMAQGRWREAALHATKVLDVAPWQYYAHIRLMACEEAMQQWNILENHASKVAERYPSDATIQVYLARAYISTGKTERALASYKRVKEMIPEHIEAIRFLNMNKK